MMALRDLDAEAIVKRWHTDPIDTWRKQQKARQHATLRQAQDATHQRDPRRVLAEEIEARVIARLEELGYTVETTGYQAHHDLLVNGRLRIEVKAALWTRDWRNSGTKRGRYQANLRKNRADLYIFVARNGRDHHFIIPAEALAGQRTVTIRSFQPKHYRGKFAAYREAWEQVEQALARVANRPKQLNL